MRDLTQMAQAQFMYVSVKVPGVRKIDQFVSMKVWKHLVDTAPSYIVSASGPHDKAWVDFLRSRYPHIKLTR